LVTMVGLALYTGTAENPSVAPGYFDHMNAPKESRLAALAVLAADAATIRAEAREEFERVPGKSGFDWGYNTFRKYPALRHADGRVFTIHPEYVLERCTFDAFELKVRMELRRRQATGDRDASRLEGAAGALFGRAHEAYASDSLHAQVPELPGGAKRLWTEAELQAVWPERPHCDFVVDCGTAVLAFEVVSKHLIEQSYAAGAIDALEHDLAAIVDKKARQLDSTINCVTERGTDLGIFQSAPVVPLIVSTAGFPWNPLIARVAHERVAGAGLLTHARVLPLRVMTIRNLEEAEALVQHGGPSLSHVLTEAHAHGDDGFAVDQLVHARGHRLRRPARLDPYWVQGFRDLALLYGMDPDSLDQPRGA
jgi:hypothetical protein